MKLRETIRVMKYEIPANKAFLEAAACTSNIGDHRLKLGIFIRRTDEFIGWCCTGIKDELPAPNREIMYAISNQYQNKGFATAASRGLIDYLFANTDVDILNAIVLPTNVSSNRVIEKCRLTFVGQVSIENDIYNHHKLSRSEWIIKDKMI